MKNISFTPSRRIQFLILLLFTGYLFYYNPELTREMAIESSIDFLLRILTLEEKLGQLNVMTYSVVMVGTKGDQNGPI